MDWPTDILPASCEFFLQYNTTIFSSPITRSQQALRRQGEMWRCAITLGPKDSAAGRRLDALLIKLRGAYETVNLCDFARPEPAGDGRDRAAVGETRFTDNTTFSDDTVFIGGPSVVAVVGDHAMGATEIVTDGWVGGVTGILLAGDYVGIDSRLYMVTDDADSSGMGRATLAIAPSLRAAVADGALINRTRPTAAFRLVDDGQPNRRVEPGLKYTFNLSFVEAQ